ncbi:hypothetical protein TNCV_3438801 [Trichonephila clavipes]|nr:hypothetical protein TNCV_3438801 [Trichonephila clavipes]
MTQHTKSPPKKYAVRLSLEPSIDTKALPIQPVPTDDVVSLVFIVSSALEQVVVIHPGRAAEWAGLLSI